jgi:DNA-binding FadR family transcriptional regulator
LVLSGPVRQAPLVLQVSEQFRGLIESGAWAVGTKIPGENQLATELGVSRGTIREALRSLSLTGLLEPRVGDGTYVRATNEITGVLVRDDLSSLDHVLNTRAGLEAAAAHLAAQRTAAHLAEPQLPSESRTAERAAAAPLAAQPASAPDPAAPAHPTFPEIDALDAALATRSAAHEAGDFDAYVAADAAFHRGVVETSGNPLLLRLYDAVAEVLTESIHQTATIPEEPRIRDAHVEVVAAIRAGDPEAAARASYALIDSVKEFTTPA